MGYALSKLLQCIASFLSVLARQVDYRNYNDAYTYVQACAAYLPNIYILKGRAPKKDFAGKNP